MQTIGGGSGRDAASTAGRRHAFLVLERHRERLTAELARRLRPGARYANILLVSKVVRLQCGYLGAAGESPLGSDSPGNRNGEVLGPWDCIEIPEWAKPWGGICLVDLYADLERHAQARESLRRWLPAAARRRAAAVAGARMAAISAEVLEAARSQTGPPAVSPPAESPAAQAEVERNERSWPLSAQPAAPEPHPG